MIDYAIRTGRIKWNNGECRTVVYGLNVMPGEKNKRALVEFLQTDYPEVARKLKLISQVQLEAVIEVGTILLDNDCFRDEQ